MRILLITSNRIGIDTWPTGLLDLVACGRFAKGVFHTPARACRLSSKSALETVVAAALGWAVARRGNLDLPRFLHLWLN
jgi:hypothetical protein